MVNAERGLTSGIIPIVFTRIPHNMTNSVKIFELYKPNDLYVENPLDYLDGYELIDYWDQDQNYPFYMEANDNSTNGHLAFYIKLNQKYTKDIYNCFGIYRVIIQSDPYVFCITNSVVANTNIMQQFKDRGFSAIPYQNTQGMYFTVLVD